MDASELKKHPIVVGYSGGHFTEWTESGVKRTASHPETREHIRIARRTSVVRHAD